MKRKNFYFFVFLQLFCTDLFTFFCNLFNNKPRKIKLVGKHFNKLHKSKMATRKIKAKKKVLFFKAELIA